MDTEGIFEAAILSVSITLKNLATQIKLQRVNVVHFTLRGHFISYTCTICYNYIVIVIGWNLLNNSKRCF